MKKLGTILGLSIAGLALIFAFSACNLDFFAPKGTMSLSLTDAPIDADNVSGYTAGNDLVVYAYEDGAYDAAVETADPAEGGSRFPNAVTSSKVGTDGAYGLWFLAAGTYDVVVAEYDNGTFVEAAELASDVAVEAATKTTQDIDASSLN
jgi:hypothetical protein